MPDICCMPDILRPIRPRQAIQAKNYQEDGAQRLSFRVVTGTDNARCAGDEILVSLVCASGATEREFIMPERMIDCPRLRLNWFTCPTHSATPCCGPSRGADAGLR
jgi:hypothetical protein